MTKKQFVGAIDQGTTSTRFVIFDENGKMLTYHQMEFEQHYLHPGWVEHDPYDILASVDTCIEHAIRKLSILGYDASSISCVGITNQRETTVAWDSETGQPLCPAIVWSDGRTAKTVQELASQKHLPKERQGVDALRGICGLPITTYFSAVKLKWMLDHVPEVKQAHDQNRLQFGTIDTWLIYNLTGGVENNGALVTDVTNASRTMLMDINTLQWSNEAINFFGFKGIKLAKIVPSSSIYGKIHSGSLKGVPIAGCLGDQQSALVGQKCFHVGDAKNTYGTGCFMLFNTGESPVLSRNGLLTTVAYQFGNDKPSYALEGSVAVAGSSIQWLRDSLGIIDESKEISSLAEKVEDTAGVYFVTAFTGLFAPYWRDDARGTICGLTQFTKREHIARATLEAVCYQSRAILEAMNKDSKTPLRSLKVDGGVSNSDICMQIQADILNIEVDRPQMRETTALGAAIAAGIATGVWKNIDEVHKVNTEGRTVFKPRISEKQRNKMYTGWKEAVTRSLGWANVVSGILDEEV
ncbi:glycerol kinase [Rhizopus microsporus var. microsporus]|uniref:glycerol kinase n=2 Tax=Rhizopus microsporus TaxID=58291 RepID=A0A2G4T967_RHIZD|nr:glycerol kinase [Rhizopus microsporus ATCC 52813]ORE01759.1 glycerol kinase [Rhizopus microsporus var. microsporus]PHZ17552.1 glycerol kinase [Rhizopus microsporus ATCC 52813]